MQVSDVALLFPLLPPSFKVLQQYVLQQTGISGAISVRLEVYPSAALNSVNVNDSFSTEPLCHSYLYDDQIYF